MTMFVYISPKLTMGTVQTAPNLPPGSVLMSPTACINMRLNTATFYGKIGTFEAICVPTPPCSVTIDYPCSAMISHDITQP